MSKIYRLSLSKARELLDKPTLGFDHLPTYVPQLYARLGMDTKDSLAVRFPGLNRQMVFNHDGSLTQEFPTKAEMAVNLSKSLVKNGKRLLLSKGRVKVPDEVYQQRLAQCKECPYFATKRSRCKLCGCSTHKKLRLAAETCPHPEQPRWGPYTAQTAG